MSEKEEKILNEILDYYEVNKAMPTIRYLQIIFNYRSTNSIFKYLKSLESKGYLYKNNSGKLVISMSANYKNKSLKKIKIINKKEKYIHLFLEKDNNYFAYQIKNNDLKKYGIIKNDTVIIQKTKNIKNNNIGLFLIDNKYQIMIYNYKDGFYILSSKEEIVLNKIKLIGKVIYLERKLKNFEV